MDSNKILIPPATAARLRGVARRTIWNWMYRQWIATYSESGHNLVDAGEVMAFQPPRAGIKLGGKRNAPFRVTNTPTGVAG